MILGATPLILTTLLLSTPPVTIHTTTHQEAPMATGITPDRGVGGGTNRQNRGNPDPFRLNLITNPTNRGSGYPTPRGTHPIANTVPTTMTETTSRPKAR